jgi:soluble lytic murein transglycosylase-like protein
MAALRSIIAAILLLGTSPAQADPVDRWRGFISEAALRFAIPERWISRVMRAESGGKTVRAGRPITSRAGAMGLMQVMPPTWEAMRAALNLGNNPHDPHDNIIAGTAYLRMMYDRFGFPGLFGAYNAGPGRYSAYLGGRSRLPGETIAYMASVTSVRAQPDVAAQRAPPRPDNGLFYAVRSPQKTASAPFIVTHAGSLFVALTSVSGTAP